MVGLLFKNRDEINRFLRSYTKTEEFKNHVKSYNTENPESFFLWSLQKKRFIKKSERRKRPKVVSISKKPSERVIHTIGYYGSKKSWTDEYQVIFEYLSKTYNLTKLVDVFGGSGIISLVGSKSGLFSKVYYNDIFYYIVNYHATLKDPEKFKEFIYHVDRLGRLSWDELSQLLLDLKSDINQYKTKKKFTFVNPEKAALYYALKHHEFNKQGGVSEDKKPFVDYIETLKRTHALYDKIEISNLHFQRVIKEHMTDPECLIVLDPPYVKEKRKQKVSYSSELSYEKHRGLLETLLDPAIKAKIILCGYDSLQYKHKLNSSTGWQCIEFNFSGGTDKDGDELEKECIWVNFDFSELLTERKKPTYTEMKTHTQKPINQRPLYFNFKY